MLAGRLCFSQCELVALPPRLHHGLFSIRSVATVTVSHRKGGKDRTGQRRGYQEEMLPRRTLDIRFCKQYASLITF